LKYFLITFRHQFTRANTNNGYKPETPPIVRLDERDVSSLSRKVAVPISLQLEAFSERVNEDIKHLLKGFAEDFSDLRAEILKQQSSMNNSTTVPELPMISVNLNTNNSFQNMSTSLLGLPPQIPILNFVYTGTKPCFLFTLKLLNLIFC
jgi:hypothetical protein